MAGLAVSASPAPAPASFRPAAPAARFGPVSPRESAVGGGACTSGAADFSLPSGAVRLACSTKCVIRVAGRG